MKMNINRASDLSSISVFPPHARRSNAAPAEQQVSQLRSQQSQQSISQQASQRGSFSQLTQSSLDEAMANDQRLSSQEREIAFKKVNNWLPPINHKREESQIQLARSSSNLMRKWNPELKCQISEELEQRIGMIETSLSRFGMILDSLQSDVMQVNKGTKEISLETEHIRQKLILHDSSLQLLNKEQADMKASLDGGMKSILEQLSKATYQDNFQKIFVILSTIPEQLEISLRKLKKELCKTFTAEIQAMTNMKVPDQKVPMPNVPAPKATANPKILEQTVPATTPPAAKSDAFCTTTQNQRRLQQTQSAAKISVHAVKTVVSPKIEVGCWKSVKSKQSTGKKRAACKQVKWEEVSPVEQEKVCRVIIDSDEEIDGGFSCLLDQHSRGNNFIREAEKETERILRRARRTKRKYDNPIIIN